jgi:Uma2 family endonuclease
MITRDSPSNLGTSPSATSSLADRRLSEESRTSVVAVAAVDEEEDGYDHEESHPDIYQVADNVDQAMAILQMSTMPSMVTLSDTYTVAHFEDMFPDNLKGCHRCLIDGKVLLYELPSRTHERPAAEIYGQLRSQSRYISSGRTGDIFFDTIEHRVLQPDQSIFVWHEDLARPGAMDARNISKLPKVVVEVSFRQPFDDIFQRVSTYSRKVMETVYVLYSSSSFAKQLKSA